MNVQRDALKKAVAELAEQLSGRLIQAGDEDYSEARKVWNGMIDRHPALMAFCANTADVVTCIRFAREHDLLVSVRSGGHNVAGHATNDGGMVIDLSAMNQVDVDPDKQIARAGGGATIGDLDAATQQFGLAAQ